MNILILLFLLIFTFLLGIFLFYSFVMSVFWIFDNVQEINKTNYKRDYKLDKYPIIFLITCILIQILSFIINLL